jgi:hypothetical protein
MGILLLFSVVDYTMNSPGRLRPAAVMGVLPRRRHGWRHQRCLSTCCRPWFLMRFGPTVLQRRGELIFTHLGTQRRQGRAHDGGVPSSSFGNVIGVVHWHSGTEAGLGDGDIMSSCSESGRLASGQLVEAWQWWGAAARVLVIISKISALETPIYRGT